MKLVHEKPTIDEYIAIRELMGWGVVSSTVACRTIESATFTACLREESELVGLLRIVGDGVLYIVIADVMVHPAYVGRGLGNDLMEAAITYINGVADSSATITLVPLPGREGFYEKYGFITCPNEVFGPGMTYLGNESSTISIKPSSN